MNHSMDEFIVVNRLNRQCTHILTRKEALAELLKRGQSNHKVKPIYRDLKGNAIFFIKGENQYAIKS